MKRLFGYLKHHKLITVLAPLFKCLEACFELFVPLVIAGMIDQGIRRGNISYVLRMGGMLLLLALIGLSCSLFAQYFSAKAAAYVGQNLRKDLFCHIHSLGYPEIDALCRSILGEGLSMSVASFRADSVTRELVESLAASGLKTLTLAPEAGSARMRAVINKGIEEHHLFTAIDLTREFWIL